MVPPDFTPIVRVYPSRFAYFRPDALWRDHLWRRFGAARFSKLILTYSFAVLHNFPVTFTNAAQNYTNSDGANPSGKLLLLGNTLYGTAEQGGINAGGTIFSVQTNGNTHHRADKFCIQRSERRFSLRGVGLAVKPTIFGTTPAGYSPAQASFSKSAPRQWLFHCAQFLLRSHHNGGGAYGQLLASGTNLYGTTYAGASNVGCIYKINTNGTGFSAPISRFSPLIRTPTPTTQPFGQLTLSGNVLYGTTLASDATNSSVIFTRQHRWHWLHRLFSFSAMNDFDWLRPFRPPRESAVKHGKQYIIRHLASWRRIRQHGVHINTDGTWFCYVAEHLAWPVTTGARRAPASRYPARHFLAQRNMAEPMAAAPFTVFNGTTRRPRPSPNPAAKSFYRGPRTISHIRPTILFSRCNPRRRPAAKFGPTCRLRQ